MTSAEFIEFLRSQGYEQGEPNVWHRTVLGRRYGAWAGKPAGDAEDPLRCQVEVPEGRTLFRQCAHKRVEGTTRCRQHATTGAVPPEVPHTRAAILTEDEVMIYTTINGHRTMRPSVARFDELAIDPKTNRVSGNWRRP